ncbi:Aste57867_11651 [Aphanomyces stellatus]|uniref:Aste57867_11651 protein n=1 Tax=Aphanomyces stellatus TaxID=120398 RepID=A0A485KU35_9STRA|nr:hypothetical protein As57867_011608 [Aphanomyces stellatus]VFT88509.1 Aste57867_11651 [Aphanomyces stellatus]
MNEGPVWGRYKTEKDAAGYAWIRGALAGDTAQFEDGRALPWHTIETEMDICRGNLMSPLELDDLGMLTHLNEPSMVHCLEERFRGDKVYCHTGDMLLAVNPFKAIKGLYDVSAFQAATRGTTTRMPHVFTTAEETYRALHTNRRKNQTVLVSGESGSGKTESTKFIMQYLAVVSDGGGTARQDGAASISDQVLQSNPILESFGNARTLRNDNSSRFGKFVKIWFSASTGALRLVGTSIETYLLEKVRLVRQAAGERNFHIFYEVLAGATRDRTLATKLHLHGAVSDYSYLNQSGCVTRRDNVADIDTFEKTMRAMAIVGFKDDEKDSILEIVASLLHLGNITFGHKAGGGSGGSDATFAEIRSLQELAWVAELLAVDLDRLRNALTNRQIKAKDEWYVVHLTKEQAEDARDAMARSIYGYLFDWLVFQVNQCVGTPDSDVVDAASAKCFIGVLDIFGFESFETNSFEQLCINYANERLQHHFIDFVMTQEQGRYQQEGISWTVLDLPQNDGCLDVLETRPTGVLALLDEECNIPKGTDAGFVRKLYQIYASHGHFRASKRDQVDRAFVVVHYAGAVRYTADGFCEKNRDKPHQAIFDLLSSSTNHFVRFMCRPLEDDDGGVAARAPLRRKSSSIVSNGLGAQFRRQLQQLIEMIGQTAPHYIRCLKPNDQNAKHEFDRKRMADQLRYGGVLEAVTIARLGYPVHLAHHAFVGRYAPLVPYASAAPPIKKKPPPPSVDAVLQALVDAHGQTSWPLREVDATKTTMSKWFRYGLEKGKTLVFVRQATYDFLEAARNETLHAHAVRLQAFCKMALARHWYMRVCAAVVTLQRHVRGHLARQVRRRRQATCTVAMWAQARHRGRVARATVLVMRQNRAAMRLQSCWRARLQCRLYAIVREAVVTVQCAWRCHVAKTHVKQLKKEALSLQHTIVERNQLRQALTQTKAEASLATQRAKQAEEELRRVQQLLLAMQKEHSTAVTLDMPLQVPRATEAAPVMANPVTTIPAAIAVEALEVPTPTATPTPTQRQIHLPTVSPSPPLADANVISTAPVAAAPEVPLPAVVTTSLPPGIVVVGTPSTAMTDLAGPPIGQTTSPVLDVHMTVAAYPTPIVETRPLDAEERQTADATTPLMLTLVEMPEVVEPTLQQVIPEHAPEPMVEATTTLVDQPQESHEGPTMEQFAPQQTAMTDLKEGQGPELLGSYVEAASIPRAVAASVNGNEEVKQPPPLSHSAHPISTPLSTDVSLLTQLAAASPSKMSKMQSLGVPSTAGGRETVDASPLPMQSTHPVTSMSSSELAAMSVVDQVAAKLALGESPDVQDMTGRTLLHYAVESGNAALVDLLLQHGANVSIADYMTQETAIHLAAKMANMELSGIFCRPDVLPTLDLNLPDKEGNTVLHLVCASARPKAAYVLELYLTLGADPNAQNVLGRTPLHICALLRRDDVLTERLLAYDADPNVYSIDKKTPLHVAVKRGLEHQAKHLVRHGASMTLPDANYVRVIESEMALTVLRAELGDAPPPPVRVPDDDIAACMLCRYGFNFLVRRYHCRRCGAVCCSDCVDQKTCRACRDVRRGLL